MLLARHFHQAAVVGAHPADLAAAVSPTGVFPLGITAPPSVAASPSSAPAEASSGSTATVVPSDTPDTPADTSGYVEENDEIQLVLHRWQQALLSNDAGQIAASYSTSVRRFFLQTDVDRGYVREYMKEEEARGSRLTRYELDHVSIEHVGHNAVDVHFVASFAVSAPAGEKSGNARTLLKLHREDGDWKIYFERDYNS